MRKVCAALLSPLEGANTSSTGWKGNQGAVGKVTPRTQRGLLFLSLCAKSCYSFGFWTQRDVGSSLLCIPSARWVSQRQPRLAVGQNWAAGAEECCCSMKHVRVFSQSITRVVVWLAGHQLPHVPSCAGRRANASRFVVGAAARLLH